ncbi:MAG: hypothetical protein QOJ99_5491 [Bryobacterales bacterium]|nr:hypothetical protein [Bryobacterales bacterium]
MPHPKLRLSLCLFPLLAAPVFGQTVTFSEQIAPIIYNNCTKCHRSGQVAPFTLASYEDVKRHAPTIAVVTQSGYMPPWKANASWAPFRDERRLTADQISLIQQWVAAGMPQGDPAKTPALPVFPDGWQLGTPDLILEMPTAFQVPADGPDIYRNFVLRTGLTTDKWIRAIELKPSARGAVHHVLFFSDTSGDGRKLDGKDGRPGFAGLGSVFTLGLSDPLAALLNPSLLVNALAGGLGGWVPGTTPAFLPEGIAYALPQGGDLILQTHFHPDGKAETEKTQIALYFAPRPPRDITQVQAPAFFGVRANIDIPGGKSNYMVRGSFTLPVDVDAFSISAHTHYLGRGTRLTATLPSGEVRILLSITDWDFNWQDTYIFKDLVALPANTRIDGELIYDNSDANPKNPFSPVKGVRWGENSTDEMGSLILNVVPRVPSDITALRNAVVANVIPAAPAVGSKPLFISAGVVDGASAQAGAVSPGKILALYGDRLGSAGLANTQVLFDDTPAPLLYSSAGQLTAIAPYALDGKTGTQVRVKNGTLLSDAVALPVAPAGPSVFTIDMSGRGQGAILNQDVVTVNSTAKPADKGSIVVIYATGEGQTSPAGLDGKLADGPFYPKPVQGVTVNIGGIPAEVLYYGAAPTLVAGVMQINVRVPADAPSGDVPLDVVVGTTHSQPGVTVAVK